jgi:branched-chain amino acid transport system permease protein
MSAARSEAPASGRGPARMYEFWVARALLGSALVSALLAAGVVLIEFAASPVTRNVMMIFLINLVVVIGLQTFTGNSGVVSFGHVGFMAIGAYAAALVSTNPSLKETQIPDAPSFIVDAELGFLPATLVAVAVTCAIALPIGFVFARLSGAAAAIATLAWLVIVRTVIANWETVTAGTFTFYGVPPYTTVWWGLGWAIVAITVARLFRESGVGLALRATSNDELVARATGVNMTRARLTAWVLSAGIAALGGVLYAHLILALAPTSFYFELTFVVLVMMIVGGRSVSGAVVGASIIAVITEVLRKGETSTGRFGLSTLVLAAIFMTMMILRPEGLLGRWELDELVRRALRGKRTERPERPAGPAEGEAGDIGAVGGHPAAAPPEKSEGRR